MGIRIGIGSLKIGQGSTGVDWSSYWATLISATVENAAPTHVVLTFPTAQTSLGASDFTIAGFTIASGSWSGAVLTLILTEAVLVFDGDLSITFKLTNTGTVTNNVADDGFTRAWYDSQDLTTITKDGANLVSRWNDKLGSGNDLIQSGADNIKPVWSTSGITTDGSNDFMVSGAFDIGTPTFFYGILKQVTYQNGDVFFDDRAIASLCKLFQNGTSPDISINAGAANVTNTNMPINTLAVVRALFNGANSKIIIDETAAVTGNPGVGSLTGLTIGARGGAAANFVNATYYEMIFRKNSDNAEVEAAIYNYLKKKVT